VARTNLGKRDGVEEELKRETKRKKEKGEWMIKKAECGMQQADTSIKGEGDRCRESHTVLEHYRKLTVNKDGNSKLEGGQDDGWRVGLTNGGKTGQLKHNLRTQVGTYFLKNSL
jgi:hypothetical protein